MNWNDLLSAGRVRRHTSSKQELEGLRAVVARDLKDAAVRQLSDDRRFATAYNAALQISKMAIACAGYRVAGQGHHQATFEALELAVGQPVSQTVAYLETCRRKRNTIDYDLANVISESEANELLTHAHRLSELVEKWIARHFPPYVS